MSTDLTLEELLSMNVPPMEVRQRYTNLMNSWYERKRQMTPNEYQALAMRTKADPAKILARLNELGPAYLQAMIASNGGTNEQGEISDILKATIEYGKGPIDPVHLTEEIGDALWRLSQLADAFGIKLEDCMRANIEKLRKRYPDTFSDYLANNRDLAAERNALERTTPHGSPADEAFSMLFEKGGSLRTSSSQPNASNVCKASDDLQAKKDFVTLCQVPIGAERVITECHEIGAIDLSPVNGAGFAEPPEIAEEQIQYPLDDEGVVDNKRWTFGQPTEPGDYEWFSPIHSLDPSKVTLFRGFSGAPGSWGRDVYWRKYESKYPGWTLGIPSEPGKYEWFYKLNPFDYKISLIEIQNFSFTSTEVYFRKLDPPTPSDLTQDRSFRKPS